MQHESIITHLTFMIRLWPRIQKSTLIKYYNGNKNHIKDKNNG